jgi:hypothetical protein
VFDRFFMTQPAKEWRAWSLLAMAALWPALGQAQSLVGGNGIKVGEGRLHPTFELEMRLDSAAGYFAPPGSSDPDTPPDRLVGEAVLHIRPGMRLEMPGAKTNLDLRGYVDYVHYTGLLTPGSTATSNLQGLADLTFTFNREGAMTVELANHFERTDRTRGAALGMGVLSLYNEARLNMPVRPGGGALEVKPEVAWGLERFKAQGALPAAGCTGEVCTPEQVSSFDYNNLRAGLHGRWRFLPKTAVVVDTQLSLRHYLQGSTPDALMLYATAGLAGLVSPKLAVTAKLGWGQDLGATRSGAVLAQLEGTYMLSQTASFKAGYVRTLQPVALLGMYRDDRGYLEGQMLLGGQLTLRGITGFDYLSFQGSRRDAVFKVDLGPQHQFQRWLIGGVGYLFELRSSSESGAGINYNRHEGYVRMTVEY